MQRSDDDRTNSLKPTPSDQSTPHDREQGMAAVPKPLPPGLSAAPSAPALFKAFRRRWLLGTTLGLLCAVAAATAAWFLVPMKYTAMAVVYISSKRIDDVLNPDRMSTDFQAYQRTQAALVKSRFVLNAALRDPKIANLNSVRQQKDPVEWLESSIKTDFPASPELLRVSLPGDDPQELVVLLNAVIDAYMDEVAKNEDQFRLARLQKLKEISNRFEESLRQTRQTYKKLAETAGVDSPLSMAMKNQFAQDRLIAAKTELITLERQLRQLRLEIVVESAEEKAKTDPVIPDAAINDKMNQDKTVLAYQAEIQELEKKWEEAAKAFSDAKNNPRLIKKYKERIDAKRLALAGYRNTQRTAVIDRLRADARAQAKDKLAQDQKSIVLKEELEKSLKNEIARLGEEIKKTAAESLDIDATKDDLDKVAAITRKVSDLVQQANIESSAATRITVKDRADVRLGQAEKRQLLIAGGAGAAALLLVLLGIAYWEFRARRIDTGDDVVYGLGWRLLGALPALPERSRGMLPGRSKDDKYWHSLLTESVDAARAVLLHAARAEGLHTVMVTSAVAGEGKTSLSCHLATSLARAGRKTLLIDCDLRSPAAHRLFELPAVPGLSELLRGEVDIPEVIRGTPANDLWLIPAGHCDGQTLQAIAQDALRPLLDRLKEQFDFIVVDSSPVLPVADSLLIGQNVDVVIFSLLRDVSRIPNVYAAYQRLATLGVRILGAVVNGVHRGAYGYSYQYYAKQAAD